MIYQVRQKQHVQSVRLAPGWGCDGIVVEVNALGVPCYQGSCSGVYLEKAFDGTGWRPAQPLRVACMGAVLAQILEKVG